MTSPEIVTFPKCSPMKRILLLLSLFFSIVSYAQNTCIPIHEDVVWANYERQYDDYYRYLYWGRSAVFVPSASDTVISGITYRGLRDHANGFAYYGAVRADSLKAWIVPPGDSMEYIVLDFDVSVGDTLRNVWIDGIGGQGVLIVNSIQSTFLGQDAVQTILLDDGACGMQWYYGLGSDRGTFWNLPARCISGHAVAMYCMSVNDTAYYPSYDPMGCPADISIPEVEREELKLYPNPASSVVHLPDEVQAVSILHLSGIVEEVEFTNQEIEVEDWPSGMYVLLLVYEDGSTARAKVSVIH